MLLAFDGPADHKSPPKDWDKVRDEVRAAKDTTRKNKSSGNSYTMTTANGSTVYHYNPNYKIIFYGSCRFGGTEMDRVELRDCDSLSWCKQYTNTSD